MKEPLTIREKKMKKIVFETNYGGVSLEELKKLLELDRNKVYRRTKLNHPTQDKLLAVYKELGRVAFHKLSLRELGNKIGLKKNHPQTVSHHLKSLLQTGQIR